MSQWGYDVFSGLHLPPSATPSTPAASREDMSHAVKHELRQIVVDCVFDKADHALAVASGPSMWRNVFQQQFGVFWEGNRGQADTVADALFRTIREIWDHRYPGEDPGKFLDAIHIPSPLSEREQQREIDDAWVLEIASDEHSMAKHYEGSARVRTGAYLGGKQTS